MVLRQIPAAERHLHRTIFSLDMDRSVATHVLRLLDRVRPAKDLSLLLALLQNELVTLDSRLLC